MSGSIEKDSRSADRPRLAYIDNLRWTVVAMVVLTHACVTYSGFGSWYYKEGAPLDAISTLAFALYQSLAQAFFMGILFFVAGFFTPGAYERKGLGRFAADRAVRLGVPTLFYMLVLDPLISLILGTAPATAGFGDGLRLYGAYLASGSFLDSSGPLWFTVALLAFSLLYGLARACVAALGAGRPAPVSAPALTSGRFHRGALLIIGVIAVGSFLVRIVQPIGTSWHNMQLGYFTQYVVLFVAGLMARRGIMDALTRENGRLWMRLALAVGLPAWLLLVIGANATGNAAGLSGGTSWVASATAAWEAFFGVSFSIGLFTLYRDRLNKPTPLTSELSRTSFGIYAFHAPVLVGVSMLARPLALHPLAKALAAAAVAWVLSFAVAAPVRRIPGVGRVFS